MHYKKNKKIKNARRIIYDGITFNSNLEKYCYIKLKENNIKFEYEGKKFNLLDSFEFNNISHEVKKNKKIKIFTEVNNKIRPITYKPDFIGNGWIIETKGYPNDSFPIKWKLFKKYLVKSNQSFELFMPRNKSQVNKTIEIIKEKYG